MDEKEGFLRETPIIGEELAIRKKKILNTIKQKKEWGYYLILVLITFVGVYIRTRNISRLKDVTTGTWTLGPDLDPFLFLRWAKYIVENGSLMIHDVMRYVPLGYNTAGEMKLLSYLIAWFYKFLSFFSGEVTVTYAAIIFPVFMFVLTTIAFFLFSRKVFDKESSTAKNTIALVATALFVVVPSLLPRTIAGIPEKESAALFFMFMAFYLFLESFSSEKFGRAAIFGALAGISTGLMALIWGGMIFIFLTIPSAILLAFLFGKIKEKEFAIYSIWLVVSFAVMMPFSTRYVLSNLIVSTSTGLGIGVFVLIGMSLLLRRGGKLKEIRIKTKLPKELFYLIISGILLIILAGIILGPSFFISQISNVKDSLIQPMTTRFGLTVAENKQPYFASDWKDSFGPTIFNLPLFFWMFLSGSVLLFSNLIKKFKKKEKTILVMAYLLFLISLIFSRYSSESVLNGTSGLSLLVYFGGVLIFLYLFIRTYLRKYREGEFYSFKELDFAYILYFIILTLGIIGARGGVRLIMVLGAISPLAISFLVIRASQKYLREKEEAMKLLWGIIAIILILSVVFTFWTYYKGDKYIAENFAPGIYQVQWQNAMKWVRDNTPQNAVFAHWWDYGYWLQSIGERATILDGGNSIVYWDYLMGRYVLTESDESKTLEFLYSHNATHLLIDSTDIGKYTAYSSIGSDENYDRFAWMQTFLMDESQIQETDDKTFYVYVGGTSVDGDIVWTNEDGQQIFLPRKKASLGAVLVSVDSRGELQQPEGLYVYNNNQYRIPLRYLYSEDKLYDFRSGIEAGAVLIPQLKEGDEGMSLNRLGAAIYLSERTVNSRVARMYLMKEESNNFRLAHSEESYFITQLKTQLGEFGEIIYYHGIQGPIKIWEINYPTNVQSNPEFLEKKYPSEDLRIAKSGEY